jgi:hypothetical protein
MAAPQRGLEQRLYHSHRMVGQEGEKSYLAAGTWGAGVFISDNGGLVWRAAVSGPDTPHIRDLANATGYGALTSALQPPQRAHFSRSIAAMSGVFKGYWGLTLPLSLCILPTPADQIATLARCAMVSFVLLTGDCAGIH